MPDLNHPSEPVRSVPQNSEPDGNVPHPSAPLGTIQNNAEGFRNVLKASERKESHTLTVREVARMFEAAGVARTERSIINWCQPNKMGVPRLDCYFDPNERRYFISLQSVESAIKEEQAKAAKTSESTTPVGSIPNSGEAPYDRGGSPADNETQDFGAFQREIMDLKITNRAKDMFIERIQEERADLVEKLMISSHKVGQLEARVLQLEAPKDPQEQKGEV